MTAELTTKAFAAAYQFASELHTNQCRKGTQIPYISHVMTVAALVLEDGRSETEAIAALLHDAIEDQGVCHTGGRDGLRAEICATFGADVLRIVEGCTDDEGYVKDKSAPQEVQREQWRRRKAAYIEHLRALNDDQVRRVSCADKLHNALCIWADLMHAGDSLWHTRLRQMRRYADSDVELLVRRVPEPNCARCVLSS